MNTQDRIALVLGRLVIEGEVKTEQLEFAAKKLAELEGKVAELEGKTEAEKKKTSSPLCEH